MLSCWHNIPSTLSTVLPSWHIQVLYQQCSPADNIPSTVLPCWHNILSTLSTVLPCWHIQVLHQQCSPADIPRSIIDSANNSTIMLLFLFETIIHHRSFDHCTLYNPCLWLFWAHHHSCLLTLPVPLITTPIPACWLFQVLYHYTHSCLLTFPGPLSLHPSLFTIPDLWSYALGHRILVYTLWLAIHTPHSKLSSISITLQGGAKRQD